MRGSWDGRGSVTGNGAAGAEREDALPRCRYFIDAMNSSNCFAAASTCAFGPTSFT